MSRLSNSWAGLKTRIAKMPDFIKIVLLVLGMLLIVGLCAVSIRKLSSNTYPHKSACDLFSQKDADKMLGEGFKQERSKDETNFAETKFGFSTCSYSKGDYMDSNRSSVFISEADVHSDKLKQANLDNLNKIMAGVEKVKGPWDVAYHNHKTGGFSFIKGNYLVVVSYSDTPRDSPGDKDNKDKSQKIATKIARKLRPF
jgi:hypothetical protein